MSSSRRQWLVPALTTAAVYAIFGGLWILLSDSVLGWLVKDLDTYAMLQTWKGWFYVFITALLVFQLSAKYLHRVVRQKEEIRIGRERLELALDSVRDGIWDWDLVTDEVFYSSGYKAMLGYEDQEVPPSITFWLDHIHPGDKEMALSANMACVENRADEFEVEFRMLNKQGEWRWVWDQGRVIARDGSGRATRMVGTHSDITERKLAQRERDRALQYVADIINSMPSMLVGVDGSGLVTHWNQAAEQMAGIPASDAVGKHLEELMPGLAEEVAGLREKGRKGGVLSLPKRSRKKDGVTCYEDVMVYPLVSEDLAGAVIRVDDVTERVRLEDVMVQSEKMLSLGGLAAGMAHEINNPLAAIVVSAQNIHRRVFEDVKANRTVAEECGMDLALMRRYMTARGIPGMIADILESGNRAGRIVSNMLNFSRKSEKRFERNDLGDLLDSTLELAASDYNLKKRYDFRKIDIRRDFASSLPPVLCEANELRQVFLNLIRNSAEAMGGKEYDGEGPQLFLRLRREEDMAVVEIEDNGPGMDAAVRSRAFEPFFTTREVGMGTGLGLSISYFIVTDQHGGTMEVHSEPGKGTRFTIRIPFEGKNLS